MGWSNTDLFDDVTRVIHEFVPEGEGRNVAYREILDAFSAHDFDTADEARLWDSDLRAVLEEAGYRYEETY